MVDLIELFKFQELARQRSSRWYYVWGRSF